MYILFLLTAVVTVVDSSEKVSAAVNIRNYTSEDWSTLLSAIKFTRTHCLNQLSTVSGVAMNPTSCWRKNVQN